MLQLKGSHHMKCKQIIELNLGKIRLRQLFSCNSEPQPLKQNINMYQSISIYKSSDRHTNPYPEDNSRLEKVLNKYGRFSHGRVSSKLFKNDKNVSEKNEIFMRNQIGLLDIRYNKMAVESLKENKLDRILGLQNNQSKNLNEKQNSLTKPNNLFKMSQTKKYNIYEDQNEGVNSIIDNKLHKYALIERQRFVKKQNHLETNMKRKQDIRQLSNQSSKFKLARESHFRNSECSAQQNESFTINKLKSLIHKRGEDDYFIAKTHAQIMERRNQTQSKHQNNKQSDRLSSIITKEGTSRQSKVLINREQETKKYIALNFTRYNLNQLKSMHKAILQYSKGNASLMKKGLVTVMNLHGILIEQDALDKINVQLEDKISKNKIFKYPTRSKYQHKKDGSYVANFRVHTRKDTQYSSPRQLDKSFNSSTQIQKLKSHHALHAGRQSIEQKLKKISNFDNFLKLFKSIEISYFKKSIIDYLHILLSNCIVKQIEQRKKKYQQMKQQQLKLNSGQYHDKQFFTQPDQDQNNQQIQITYADLYEAFRKRNELEDTLLMITLIQQKLKDKFHERIKPIKFDKNFFAEGGKQSPFWNRKQNWKIQLTYLYNLCYQDNQLCQKIHEYYLRQKYSQNK